MGKFYITTAIDYANASPHLGHALEKVGADVIARWRRLCGDDVYFLLGNDEHSQNVATKAAEAGKDPKSYCDEMEVRFRAAWSKLNIGYDRFIRTTEPAHHRAAQEIFRRLRAKGDIYKGLYKSWYCVGCEARKTEKDLVDGKCPNHPNTPLQWIEEENYFFRLTKYRDQILALVKDTPFVRPEPRRNELLSVLNEGLEDISVSRSKSAWGVPVPDDPGHVIYVWFDALINYVTGAGFPDDAATFERLWPADVHVIGKDITRFHGIIWPAMLLAAGLAPPKLVHAHGFIYVKKGEARYKMSKSLGTSIDPIQVADRFGADPLRYFLMREVGFENDGDFSWDQFFDRYNSDLANDLGNLLNRVVSMTHRYLGGKLPEAPADRPADRALRDGVLGLTGRIAPLWDRYQFPQALAETWEQVRKTNAYLEETKPWTANKEGRAADVAASLRSAAESLRVISLLLSPVIPATAGRMWDQLGLGTAALGSVRLDSAGVWSYIKPDTRVGNAEPLFPRIDATAE
ncbi:MAG TPA: methionine--tRNA ligase [Planctomycetota bacterium]|nr:methionine--tRNA ligase [Planctomycetota bacterium]